MTDTAKHQVGQGTNRQRGKKQKAAAKCSEENESNGKKKENGRKGVRIGGEGEGGAYAQ